MKRTLTARRITRKTLLRFVLTLLVIALIFLIARYFSLSELKANIQAWLAPMGIWAPVIFTFIFLTNTVGMPTSWLMTLSGLLFGMEVGMVVAVIGTLAAGLLTFGLSRTLLAPRAEERLADDPRLRLINQLIARRGSVILPLIRIPPISHYTTVNVLLALTTVRLPTFAITTCIGMLPICFFYVLSGSTAADLMAGGGINTLTIVAVIIATILVLILTWIIYAEVKAIRRENAMLDADKPTTD